MNNMTKTPEKQDIPSFHLLLVAGGKGTRLGEDIPKQYLKINNQTVLEHSLSKFLNIPELKSIVIVMDRDFITALPDYIINNSKITISDAGTSRKESVYNGLYSFINVNNNDLIIIHDAVRPLIMTPQIHSILKAMQNNKAATLSAKITDTLLQDEETIDRDKIWSIQTPQAFQYKTIMDAHNEYKNNDNFTDDTGMVRSMGEKVSIVENKAPNIKITTSADFDMVKAMINQDLETRTASGFDVHAFETEKTDRPLKLGGLTINHDFALTGHSDADVVLHAVTDSILGGINKGDIGTHFPPSDAQWKDKDSAHFLKHAQQLLTKIGGNIRFIDITVMAEAPKIGPHREKMQNNIAQILNLPPSRISIKATTTEQLGFIGRKEGMACQAITTINLPKQDDTNV